MIKNGMFNLKQQKILCILLKKYFLLFVEWDILLVWIIDETHKGSIFQLILSFSEHAFSSILQIYSG